MQFGRPHAALAAALLLLACGRGPTGAPAPSPARPAAAQLDVRATGDSAAIAFLIDEGTRRSHVPQDLAYLTDVIGPRLTGSAGLRRANEWTASKLLEYGADTAGLERWPFGVGWQRGPLTMRFLAPHERWVSAVSWAWAPGTNGPRAGDVISVDAQTKADFDSRFAGKLRGAWVLLTKPYPRTNPDAPDPSDSARVDSLRRAMRRPLTEEQRAFLSNQPALLAEQGIAGQIIDGGKEFGLFTMSGSPDDIAKFPMVVVANETFAEIHRDLARGEKVRVEVNVLNQFGRDTLVQWNTVGEIRGSEKPDEVVLLGAHLDSWDIGTGATDNATGSIAVLEAARLLGALKKSGVRPKRSIRFAFFTGEEQGLYGSQYYVMTHSRELPRFQSVLVLDNGTGRIVGVALQGWDELDDLWRSMLRPLSALGPFTVRSGNKTGTDHLAFLPAGVPSFNYDQLPRGYDHTHHSQVDVFDHTVPRDIEQAATVMAVNALQLANLSQLLPRKAPR
ncbi:MAG TPA: M20/M25/M40 family metallo-hydrolase [Gemmatimonadaceae bacterium]|nr:M20/M25/M40 family metallo-hydrolase [Gemmatimonadaceae bacterium]